MGNRIFLILALAVSAIQPGRSGEGMWIPMLVDSLKLGEMQHMGFTLGKEEIYSNMNPSLKDAIVIFGGGCTGELISPEGLVLTNHHCGYSRIQAHSRVNANYLANGFWASSRKEELPNPGLTVTFLVRMEEVTKQALEGVNDTLTETDRNRIIRENTHRIEMYAGEGNHFNTEVKPFFFGRVFYLFVYEVFRDVRLVGAPPESIGRFGGDTDNWIWPRHTGDFSLFRVYADKNNKPADYSPDNIPYTPRKYFRLSVNGIREGDFTMVLGYPGRTDEYLTSRGLELIAEKSLPAKVDMRTFRLNAMKDHMNKGAESRLRFAPKYISVSNSWKKWMGVTKGVEKSNALLSKEKQELQFTRWAEGMAPKDSGYITLMDRFRRTYDLYEPVFLAQDLGGELISSIELFSLANACLTQYNSLLDSSRTHVNTVLTRLRRTGINTFRSGVMEIDRQILPELLRIYATHTTSDLQPGVYQTIKKNFKGDYKAFVRHIFQTSYFTDSIRYEKLMKKSPSAIHKALWSDPLPALYRDFNHTLLFNVYGRLDSLNLELSRLYRKYVGGLMAMEPERKLYPDANFTMRVTYGRVEGYKSADAVNFNYYTTLDGVMEKENQEIPDYVISPELKDVYLKKDFGRWATNGKIPVCFIASNHTSGGNSGSPVLNSSGDLIGINFDRNWEGTVSDYVYNPAICRNISLDIRYVLFIIDKVARASWILDELTLVQHP